MAKTLDSLSKAMSTSVLIGLSKKIDELRSKMKRSGLTKNQIRKLKLQLDNFLARRQKVLEGWEWRNQTIDQ